jgi:hypothetical protein
MLPSTQNAGFSAASPLMVLVTVSTQMSRTFETLADRFDRNELRVLGRERLQKRGEIGVLIETVEGDSGHDGLSREGKGQECRGAVRVASSLHTVYLYGICIKIASAH